MGVVDSSEQDDLKTIARIELILPGGETGKVPVQ